MERAVRNGWDCSWMVGHPDNRMPLPVSVEQFANTLTREERATAGEVPAQLRAAELAAFTLRMDFRGDLPSFQREHPATPEQAFTAVLPPPLQHPGHSAHAYRAIRPDGRTGVARGGCRAEVDFSAGRGGALRIYRMPERGRVYACGADPAGGADANQGRGRADPGDRAVAQILDRDTGEQCATLRLRCMPGDSGRYINKLCRFYGTRKWPWSVLGRGWGSLEALLDCEYPASLILSPCGSQ